MQHVYGSLDSDGIHTDTSKTERGAKNYATRNDLDNVSIRYNCGYQIAEIAEKIDGKWVDLYSEPDNNF